MKNSSEVFFLFWLSVYMQKINAIQSFHQEVYVIKVSCDQLVETFPPITQAQEVPQIRDLYSKIDNNINFIKEN